MGKMKSAKEWELEICTSLPHYRHGVVEAIREELRQECENAYCESQRKGGHAPGAAARYAILQAGKPVATKGRIVTRDLMELGVTGDKDPNTPCGLREWRPLNVNEVRIMLNGDIYIKAAEK